MIIDAAGRGHVGRGGAPRRTARSLVAAALAASTAAATLLVAAPTGATPTGGAGAVPPVVAAAAPAPVAVPVAGVLSPAPAELVRETGSWFAHGRTLDLRADGTGTLAAWVGAYDGTRIQLRLIPAPGPASVAEVTAVENVGAGGLGPDERPAVGGLVTVSFGAPIRTAHVEWSAGPHRVVADLCPAAGLTAEQMNALRCGA